MISSQNLFVFVTLHYVGNFIWLIRINIPAIICPIPINITSNPTPNNTPVLSPNSSNAARPIPVKTVTKPVRLKSLFDFFSLKDFKRLLISSLSLTFFETSIKASYLYFFVLIRKQKQLEL